MEKCIVFGASGGGKNYIQQQKDYEVILIVDNDPKKNNTVYNGILITEPANILIHDYDFIVVASMYYQSITKQLLELGIPSEKIKYAPKNLMKKNHRPFQDQVTYQYAWELLKHITSEFDKLNIQYFLDFGTLLGFYRGKDLIPWDDDIDIALKVENMNQVDLIFNLINNKFKSYENIEWQGNKVFSKSGELIGLDFSLANPGDLKDFSINLGILRFKNNFAYQVMNYAPKEHFESYEELIVQGVKFRIPYSVEEYLVYTYGDDWKQEKKDTTFKNNTKTFFEPNIL